MAASVVPLTEDFIQSDLSKRFANAILKRGATSNLGKTLTSLSSAGFAFAKRNKTGKTNTGYSPFRGTRCGAWDQAVIPRLCS